VTGARHLFKVIAILIGILQWSYLLKEIVAIPFYAIARARRFDELASRPLTKGHTRSGERRQVLKAGIG
jgi:hypothetical protein